MTPVRKLYLDNIRWMTVVLVVIYKTDSDSGTP